MRRFSFRPAVTLEGRAFNGLRGFAGKPNHPPLTDTGSVASEGASLGGAEPGPAG